MADKKNPEEAGWRAHKVEDDVEGHNIRTKLEDDVEGHNIRTKLE
ncbi:MAG: hypothetical protein QOH90_541, partial [Actinomycetota bacterium]|nr:hypothetical protein [Actinomycetota bacterium]